MIFLPWNLTVFLVNLGSAQVPLGHLQYLQRLWCKSTEDSSKKSTFCHFQPSSSSASFGLWQMPRGFFLIAFCLSLVSGHWFDHESHFKKEFYKLFCLRWRGPVELWCSRKGAGLGFWSQQTFLQSSCLAGSAGPGLVKNISTLFKSFNYPLYLMLGHIEHVSHLSTGSGLHSLDNQRFVLRVNLRHVVRGQPPIGEKIWCSGIMFIHTH